MALLASLLCSQVIPLLCVIFCRWVAYKGNRPQRKWDSMPHLGPQKAPRGHAPRMPVLQAHRGRTPALRQRLPALSLPPEHPCPTTHSQCPLHSVDILFSLLPLGCRWLWVSSIPSQLVPRLDAHVCLPTEHSPSQPRQRTHRRTADSRCNNHASSEMLPLSPGAGLDPCHISRQDCTLLLDPQSQRGSERPLGGTPAAQRLSELKTAAGPSTGTS